MSTVILTWGRSATPILSDGISAASCRPRPREDDSSSENWSLGGVRFSDQCWGGGCFYFRLVLAKILAGRGPRTVHCQQMRENASVPCIVDAEGGGSRGGGPCLAIALTAFPTRVHSP